MTTEIVPLGEGRQVTYQVVGDGEPALWFEGGPGLNATLGRADCEVLADRFRCYLVDAPGTGGTTAPPEVSGYAVREAAAFYEAVRRALGLPTVTLLGHSWGGTVCLAYAALYPEVTRRCIAIDAWSARRDVVEGPAAQAEMAAGFARHAGKPWFAAAKEAWDADASDLFDRDDPEAEWSHAWPLYFAHPERPLARRHIARLTRDLRFGREPASLGEEILFRDDIFELLPLIRVPTLVVAGELDFVCGPAHAREIARRVPGAELVIFPDCGHIPAYEKPEEFRRAVFDWCDRHSGRAYHHSSP
jgi:pimeloyl-ACP methyl ester carboxylesterase